MKPDIDECLAALSPSPEARVRVLQDIHKITEFCQITIDRWFDGDLVSEMEASTSEIDSDEAVETVVSETFNNRANVPAPPQRKEDS